MRAAVIALLLALGVAGCGAGSESDGKVQLGATSTKTFSFATQDPTSTPDLKLGDESDLVELKATAMKFQRNVPPVDANVGGKQMDAVLVRMCNVGLTAADGPEQVFSTYSWQLTDDKGGTYQPSGTTYRQSPSPQFPDEKALAQGKCAQGWIVYDVPKTSTIAGVTLAFANEDRSTWTLR